MSVRRLLSDKGSYVSTVRPQQRIREVMERLEVDEVAALIVSEDDRTILGIVSVGDIVRGLQQCGGGVVEKRVDELMTRDVVTCDMDESIKRVLTLMDRHQIRHVPITQNGELRGIINILDVVRYRLREIEFEAEALKSYVTGRT